MRILLDGSDWVAKDYLSPEAHALTQRPFTLRDMLLDDARSGGFAALSGAPAGCYHATVPGCDRSVLEENGEIGDPYYGMNLERCEWSERKGWAFRKEFTLPQAFAGLAHIDLTFRSIGYSVCGFLNEGYLGRHTGMFDPWTIDVSDHVKRDGGKNMLVLLFDAAPKAAPNHCHTEPAEFAHYRMCQMVFGWDWARQMVPTGIFDHVELHGVANARIHGVHFRTQGRRVSVSLEIGCLEAGRVPVSLSLSPLSGKGKTVRRTLSVSATPGELASGAVEFEVADAEFWYPNGYGAQPLYRLEVGVPGDEWEEQVAFRDLAMVRNPGSCESSYPLTFEYNGKRIFARGLNWVPADQRLSAPDAAGYERLVRLAASGGFNLFRVWGGGILEKEEFYRACDKYGMLVWQEFPHACSMYPHDAVSLAKYRREAEAAIRRTRNHASMALYCGGNEVFYYNESPDSPIYRQYGELVSALAPEYPYHLSSPDLSRPGERDHGTWNFMEHSYWNAHFRRLASELGCEGFAEAESIDRFIPAGDPWPGGQHWKYHFSFNDARRSWKPIQENFAPSSDRWEQSQASMATQGGQLSYVMGHYRTRFPANSGCFLWQYNESWPTNAFSIVDYYTLPKMAFYLVARSNAPRILFLEDESWMIRDGRFQAKLYRAFDTTLPKGEVRCTVTDLEGRELLAWRKAGDFAAGAAVLAETLECRLPKDLPGGMVLANLSIHQGRNEVWRHTRIYGAPDFAQAFRLPPADLRVTAVQKDTELRVTLVNRGGVAAMMVRVSAVGLPHEAQYWRDNYLSLLPGEKRLVVADLSEGRKAEGVVLRGWNARASLDLTTGKGHDDFVLAGAPLPPPELRT